MIFAQTVPPLVSGMATIILFFILFVIVMVILVHWSNRNPAPTTGQWRGSEYVDAPTIAGYLVDPDTKLPYIFVTIHALSKHGDRWVIDGKYPYKPEADETCKVKLIRSGTGFRVYNNQDHEGKWMPCR